jgi:phage tail-like protein
VKWNGKYVAGISKVGGLTRSTAVVEHRQGGDPSVKRRSAGQTLYAAITLERGVTHDPEFEAWANKVWDFQNSTAAMDSADKPTPLKDFRQDIILEMYNEAGQKVIGYNIYRCWVSEFTAMPDLDSNEDAVAIQSIKLENEGWDRDTSVEEPAEE